MTHDDVIGTRRVSYIIYFSEPTPKWDIKDGGLLELYPLAEAGQAGQAGQTEQTSVLSGVPAVTPTACLCPAFNTMAMFVVQPGKSYHAVQEVRGSCACGLVLSSEDSCIVLFSIFWRNRHIVRMSLYLYTEHGSVF